MKRFLLFYFIISIASLLTSCKTEPDQINPDEFRNPVSVAPVHAWWHWLDNAITKEGITKDLESMKARGISTLTIFNVRRMNEADFGVSPVIFDTEEWYRMFKWSLDEAHRLGLKIGVHNCNGWATSGGPWVDPDHSMKRITWSKTEIEGGQVIKKKLAAPAGNYGYYRDIALLAYKSKLNKHSFQHANPMIRVKGSDTGNRLFDGNPFSTISISSDTPVDIMFPETINAGQIALTIFDDRQYGRHDNISFVLNASSDGKNYKEIHRVMNPRSNIVVLEKFPLISAKFFRIEIRDADGNEQGQSVNIGELELLRNDEKPLYYPYISNHLDKTVTTRADKIKDLFTDNYPAPETLNFPEIINITSKMNTDGEMEWDAPEGNWTLLRVGYTTTGAKNHPSSAAGRGLEIDKMDTAALNLHFRSFPLELIKNAGDHAGNTFQFLLADSWECRYQNWTSKFAEEFEKRRGYSIFQWLPVICGEMVHNSESTERFLHDYRQTIADLIEENYYKHFASLCHDHGLQIHAEVIYGGNPGATLYPPLDILKANSYIDMPMTEFWATNPVNYRPIKRAEKDMVADAAALYGQKVVGAEAYTGLADYQELPWDLKLYGDQAYCSGVNQMILHSFVHQPFEKIPGMTLGEFGQTFHRHIPWWQFSTSWFTYQGRVQYILQNSTTVVDLLYFTGDRLYDGDFLQNENYQLPEGYNIQKCNHDILANYAEVKDHEILLRNGMSYKFLILPDEPVMELKTLEVISELVKEGAVILGPKPVKTLSNFNDAENDLKLKELAGKMWGKDSGELSGYNNYGKGRVYHGTDIQYVLKQLGLMPEFSFTKRNDQERSIEPLLYIRKIDGNNDIFYVVNQEDRPINVVCNFRVDRKIPEIWDPAYGIISSVPEYEYKDGIMSLEVQFQPRESLFFIFGNNQTQGIIERRKAEKVYLLEDFKGKISFDDKNKMPPVEINQIKPLTEFDDPNIKYYSGLVTYQLNFDVPADIASQNSLFISPGHFGGTCQLELNGHDLGDAFIPNYRFNVSGLIKEKDNELIIRLGNNFRNRIIGDFIEYGELKNIWTTSPVSTYLNRNSALHVSGLSGPVILYSTLKDAHFGNRGSGGSDIALKISSDKECLFHMVEVRRVIDHFSE